MKNSETIRQDFKVAIYFLRLSKKISKSYIPLIILSSFFLALTPFINIIMPKFIIDELMGTQRIEKFILFVSIIIFGNALLSLINRLFDAKVAIADVELINGIELHLGKHMMNMDFESLEDAKTLDLKERALAPINQQGVILKMMNSIKTIIQTSVSIIGLIAIISILNIMLIIVIIGIVLVNSFIFKKSQESQFNFHKMLTPLNRKFGYYARLSTDFSMAMDVRLYNMSPYILKKVAAYHKESTNGFGKLFGIIGFYKGLSNINVQLQLAVVYSYMVYKVYTKSINIGGFTMYISAANSFSNSISLFLNSFVEFRQMCKYLDLFMQFESIPTKKATGEKKVNNITNATIEFKNVYFKYSGSGNYSLKNVSIKISSGEKLSIVGQNGAGKTTFIKLLCRLYDPEKGEIFLNGVNIMDYEYNEYMKLLSVVFQDYKLFSFSIKENIVFDDSKSTPDEAVLSVIKNVGLLDKISSLEEGIKTSIYKTFDEKGIEFSGGESQKLAIARAIFKNAPIVILDEPTAALDPYAEFEIYSNLNELVKNNTAIYISHRLSSCKFCDNIAVFENGELIEYGHHDELVSKGKLYAAMWNAQARNYIN